MAHPLLHFPSEARKHDFKQIPVPIEKRGIGRKGLETVNQKRTTNGTLCSTPIELTPAENRVLRLISRSMTNREIAGLLKISPATVKRHVENILRKLGLRNRIDAAIYALALQGCPARAEVLCPLERWRENLQGIA